ncbi:MAG: transcriptional repressor [Lachnospiraceae bacterium]|nr:transcriptional repressor [Lachnospiraceae bacterium]
METHARTINKSKQRDAIVEYLMSRKDHPTADKIYHAIREDFPNISLGTVYRNLTLLAELGMIQKVSCGDSSEHFDGNPMPHNHFICTNCGNVIDLEMENIDFVDTLAAKHFNGTVTGHNIYFQGICENCISKNQE